MQKQLRFEKMGHRDFFKRIACFLVMFSIVFFCFFSSKSLAHKVVVFAWVDGDIVHVESKFSGGRKVVSGKVEVFDLSENFICSGKTDDKGMFSFKITRKTGMKIKLVAGMGHMGQWIISAEEAGVLSETEPDKYHGNEKKSLPVLSKDRDSSCKNLHCVNSETKKIIEQTIDRKLKPVYVILSKMQSQGASISDILGGVGYIFGFMGIIIYFKSKKQIVSDYD